MPQHFPEHSLTRWVSLYAVCVCVCVRERERERVGQKGDRSAANRSGIRKGENYSFWLVASLAILVNHTPLGRVKTCVIFLLGASALTSV